MRFISLFSGAGGFDLGLEAAGWTCVAQVEWDQRCQTVLARRWPDVPRWSDIADVDGAHLPAAELVAFGSPCQDLSIAGKRAGMDGDRSSLFFHATRIIREMREATDGRYPTFALWENVVGALSSTAGRDFAAVLDELADCGAVDIGWRVLDARWFGVPQRRRRIFVVADFAGQRASALHAEPEGVRRHPRTGGTARTDAATGADGSPVGGRFFAPMSALDENWVESDVVGSLRADASRSAHAVTHTHTPQHSPQPGSEPVDLTTTKPKQVTSSSLAATLNSGGNNGGFRTEPGEHLVVIHD